MPTGREIERQHAQTIKRLLKSENDARKRLRSPISNATARVQATLGKSMTGASRAQVYQAIREHGAALRSEITDAVLNARQTARAFGREQLASDLGPVRRWAVENGVPPPLAMPSLAEHARALDLIEADRVASALHTQWSSAVMNGFNTWEKKGQRGNLLRAIDVNQALSGKVDVHAATQANSAFSDERQTFWDRVAAGAEDAPNSPAPALFHVWSAVLDENTCPACAALDGATVPIDEDFEDGATTPLHPNCRCVTLTTFDEDELEGGSRQQISDNVKTATVVGLIAKF